jgi:UDP-N-acetylglucosamine transferase subunit ALG13
VTVVSYAEAVEYVSGDTLQQWANDASVVVTHGGPSLLLQLVDSGRVPIVIHASANSMSMWNDHQVEFAEFLAARGLVILVRTEMDLRRILEV